MKIYHNFLIPFFILGIFASACNFFPTKFRIDNKSSYKLDSAIIYFNKYEVHFARMLPGETLYKLIRRDSVSSGHDIFITGRIVTSDTVINVPFIFSDLGGSFNEITLVINKDLKTTWSIR